MIAFDRRIWKAKKHELKQWFFYNVVLGLSPILLSWVILAFGHTSNFSGPLLDGTVLIFAVTLSAASMSFFEAETQRKLKETESLLFNILISTLLVGSCGFAANIALRQFAPQLLWVPFCLTFSLLIVALSVVCNFVLAGIRLAYEDEQLLGQLVVADLGKVERDKMEKAALSQNSVDGTSL
jgi:lysylphosphatidylglycerol synthetase-like protein (DUF2156 family)